MKNNITRSLFTLTVIIFFTFNINAQIPTILINGDSASASSAAKFPFWLSEGTSLDIGNYVLAIPVIEYNLVTDGLGGYTLQLFQVKLVNSSQSVPVGKVWKVESAILDKTIGGTTGGGTGDNWGSQSVIPDVTLTGLGTSGSPLGIAQQGADTNQFLRWDGADWLPADGYIYTDSSLAGTGESSDPLHIAQNGATSGQVLRWNGNDWVPTTNYPSYRDCPAGFTAVNSRYCIETNERAAANFWTAQTTCNNLDYQVASWVEWRYACQKGGLSPALQNMTNAWEWVRDINSANGSYNAARSFVVGNGGCTMSDHPSNSSGDETQSWSYRCVFYR